MGPCSSILSFSEYVRFNMWERADDSPEIRSVSRHCSVIQVQFVCAGISFSTVLGVRELLFLVVSI